MTKYPGEKNEDLADIIIRMKNDNGRKSATENKNFSTTESATTENKIFIQENISSGDDPFKQSLHEMLGEFIPLSWLVPEPEDKDSEEWREWLVNRTA